MMPLPQPTLALGAGAGVLYFVGALALLHVARRDLSPASHYVSEYAHGRLGWLMTSALLALSGGSVLLCGAVFAARPDPLVAIVVAPLGAWGIAIGVAGVAPTRASRTAPPDRRAVVHQRAAGVAFAAMLVAMWVLAFASLRSDGGGLPPWMAPAVACGATAAYLLLRRAAAFAPRLAGAAQRLYLACAVAWLLVLAAQVWIVPTR